MPLDFKQSGRPPNCHRWSPIGPCVALYCVSRQLAVPYRSAYAGLLKLSGMGSFPVQKVFLRVVEFGRWLRCTPVIIVSPYKRQSGRCASLA